MPFAGYEDFEECVKKNQDKKNPEAYCGSIKHKVEDELMSVEEFISKETEKNKRKVEDIAAGKHQRCKDRLKYLGFSEEEAQMICAAVFLEDTKLFGEKKEPTKKEIKAHKYRYDPRTRHTGGHPTHVEIGVVPRPMALPLQAPHRPPKSEHIMRTKMEKVQTLEERWLTLEELAKRAQYQKAVTKTGKGVKGQTKFTVGKQGISKKDSLFYDKINQILTLFPDYAVKDAIEFALDNELVTVSFKENEIQDSISSRIKELLEEDPEMEQDEAFAVAYRESVSKNDENDIYGIDVTVFDSVNDLNNVLKIPVTLAKEMVQPYHDGKHFKPFKELKKAIDRIGDKLPIIIEHKRFSDNDVVGYVKEIRADEKDRSIKGYAYLTESRIPSPLLIKLKDGDRVPVSIGFFADIGSGGEYNGIQYDATQRNIILNHLAICLRSKPRCDLDNCGLNVGEEIPVMDSVSNEEVMELINKKPHYFNIYNKDKEEKENIINNTEEEKIMEDTQIEDAYIPESHKKIFSKLNELLNFLPMGKRKDATDLLVQLLDKDYDEEQGEVPGEQDTGPDEYDKKKKEKKMKKEDSMVEELQNKIKELQDSVSKKDNELEEYREKEKEYLVDSITRFSQFKEDELKEKCVKELRIIEDTVSKFDPSNAKPKKPKPKKEKSFEDSEEKRVKPEMIFRETNEKFYS